jgi:hypothetical protein
MVPTYPGYVPPETWPALRNDDFQSRQILCNGQRHGRIYVVSLASACGCIGAYFPLFSGICVRVVSFLSLWCEPIHLLFVENFISPCPMPPASRYGKCLSQALTVFLRDGCFHHRYRLALSFPTQYISQDSSSRLTLCPVLFSGRGYIDLEKRKKVLVHHKSDPCDEKIRFV